MYQAHRYVLKIFYNGTIAKYKKMKYNEYESQMLTLCDFQNNGDISFKELPV